MITETVLDTIERLIGELETKAKSALSKMGSWSYNQQQEFQTNVLNRLEELKAKRRRLLGARKAAATRAANKAASR